MSDADQIEAMVGRVTTGRWSRANRRKRLEFIVETVPEVTFAFDGAERLDCIEVAEDSEELLTELRQHAEEARSEIEAAMKLIISPRARDSLRSALEHLSLIG